MYKFINTTGIYALYKISLLNEERTYGEIVQECRFCSGTNQAGFVRNDNSV